jgi:glycosyltransferase involved in cell wall biosynthesis
MHLRREPLFEITVPGKAYTYLACGRPILCAVAGDTADIIRDAGAGVTCPPEDPAALARAVRALQAMPETERRAMGESGHRAHLAKYSRAALVGRHEALLVQAARSRNIRS